MNTKRYDTEKKEHAFSVSEPNVSWGGAWTIQMQ